MPKSKKIAGTLKHDLTLGRLLEEVKDGHRAYRSAHPELLRKRTPLKTKNPRGYFSVPDTGAIFDKESLARASGRRNKATARVASLKK